MIATATNADLLQFLPSEQLLELALKGMPHLVWPGAEVQVDGPPDGRLIYIYGGGKSLEWCPFKNVEQAMDLVLHHRFHIGCEERSYSCWSTKHMKNFQSCDPYHWGEREALCRAIVLCAAWEGRNGQ